MSAQLFGPYELSDDVVERELPEALQACLRLVM